MAKKPQLPKHTQKIEVGEDEKTRRVSAFLGSIPEAHHGILLDLLELHTSPGEDFQASQRRLNKLSRDHGQALEQINRALFELIETCHVSYDEIDVLIQGQLGGLDEESGRGTIEIDPDGLMATVEKPREAVRHVIHVDPAEQVDVLEATAQQAAQAPFARQRKPGERLTMPRFAFKSQAPDQEGGSAKIIINGEQLPPNQEGAAFLRKRDMNYMTQGPSPWTQENIPQIIEDVAPLVDRFTGSAKALFVAVVCTENPDDEEEVKRSLQEYAPNASIADFKHMNGVVARSAERFAEIMRHSPDDVRQAILLQLGGAKVLPEMPTKGHLNPREQATVYSPHVGKLARLARNFRRKIRGKKSGK